MEKRRKRKKRLNKDELNEEIQGMIQEVNEAFERKREEMATELERDLREK